MKKFISISATIFLALGSLAVPAPQLANAQGSGCTAGVSGSGSATILSGVGYVASGDNGSVSADGYDYNPSASYGGYLSPVQASIGFTVISGSATLSSPSYVLSNGGNQYGASAGGSVGLNDTVPNDNVTIEADYSGNCSASEQFSFTVNSVTVATTTIFNPATDVDNILHPRGSFFSNTDVVCGVQQSPDYVGGSSNYTAYKANSPIFCKVNALAQGAGLVGETNSGVYADSSDVASYGAADDAANNANKIGNYGNLVYCSGSQNGSKYQNALPNEVMTGIHAWGSSNQLDQLQCGALTGSNPDIVVNAPSTYTYLVADLNPADAGQNFFCPSDSVVVGGIDTGGKNDSIGTFVCGQVYVAASPPPPPPAGTITVSSTNSVTGTGVASRWSFPTSTSAADPCSDLAPQVPCSGTYEAYPNQPVGLYSLNVYPYGVNGFSLKSVEKEPVAEDSQNLISSLIVFAKTALVNVANADTVCDIANYHLVNGAYVCEDSSGTQGPVDSQTVSSGTEANFIILWDPTASMSVSPSTLAFAATAGGANPAAQSLAVANNGSVGSTLQWTSSVSYTSGSGWISVTPSSDGTGLGAGNSENATISIDTTGLAVGTYQATTTFRGISEPCGTSSCSIVLANIIPVTLIVNPAGPGVSVTVSPPTASVQTNATQQFTATVNNSPGNTAVTWSVSGGGTIDSTGLYTAPASAVTATVTATSVADATKSGSANVTVTTSAPGISVTVSPPTASVQTNATQQFTATVNNSPGNTAVTWSVSGGGTIDSTGLYTAPASAVTATVTATSVADATKSGSANVTVTAPPPPPTVTITSAPVAAGGPVAVGVPVGVSCSGGSGSFTWSSPSGSFSSTTGSNTTVSYATTGTHSVTCTDSNGASGSVNITVEPDCTIAASVGTIVPPGQSTLIWSCSSGTAVTNSCSITRVGVGLGTSGSTTVAPTQTTNYVLSCTANNGLVPSSQIPPASTTVTVQTSGLHETNP